MSNPDIDRLREVRQNKSLSIEEVSEQANIPPHYVEAIENGDFSALPDPLYARGFIRTYARFLGVDPLPILRAYKNVQPSGDNQMESVPAPVSLSRTERMRQQQSRSSQVHDVAPRGNWKSFLKSKWIIGGAVFAVMLLISVLIWVFMGKEDQPVAQPVTPQKNTEETVVTTVAPVDQTKPVVNLTKSSETNKYGDVYEVKNADQVELKITAKKSTEIRVRGDGPSGKILAEKKLVPNKTETFTHEKWISLRVDNPNYVTISVNGVIIDTTGQKEVHLYQLKLIN
ncbi:RodZ domain-containing protein [Paenactinomyces guangxiensis]|uniref:Helix-turn-helix domain-containing protein n=1 Tax=Paenactinomyces guangxiensis TaxID=1490290 RepID=A0A7W1WQV3_9BACL|nr:RodZ domain-containing protein [Paenactinomyces guangxiensis]MBA4494408.1 helix-turn-helix domain-containing protein [Paenactinomyces guangxiensis]MBH8591537.1 helix-turn-helix domain-containing protein [Paenactinomyces guangxiensis]